MPQDFTSADKLHPAHGIGKLLQSQAIEKLSGYVQAHHPQLNALASSSKNVEKELIPPGELPAIEVLQEHLYQFLVWAAETEHLLAMQYLYAAFSLKKFPEEFEEYDSSNSSRSNENVLIQIEVNRRWNARLLYVARQEMEHLALVQNLIALLPEPGKDTNRPPYLNRPNYPVSAKRSFLEGRIDLMPFSLFAIEVFRFWEKPDTMDLPNPLTDKSSAISPDLTASHKKISPASSEEDYKKEIAWELINDICENAGIQPSALSENTSKDELRGKQKINTIQELYTHIDIFFYFLLEFKFINKINFKRTVNEHFGFNMTLEPYVQGKVYNYVHDVIGQIINEGEGVGNIPPTLDSHFMVFQSMYEEYKQLSNNLHPVPFNPALPVVTNPFIELESDYYDNGIKSDGESDLTLSKITNKAAITAMQLFNEAYNVMIQMLFGFFSEYEIDNTTGIRPPKVNAFFQTAFYPFMTMVIRPLGEMICRLPADSCYKPGEKITPPPRTAGPNFFFHIPQEIPFHEVLKKYFLDGPKREKEYFIEKFIKMAGTASDLGEICDKEGYHIANNRKNGGLDFKDRFIYLSENLKRIATNFDSYWEGKMVAPVSSAGFQNFSDFFN